MFKFIVKIKNEKWKSVLKSVTVLYILSINDFCVFIYLDIIKNVIMFSSHSNNSKNIIMENIW